MEQLQLHEISFWLLSGLVALISFFGKRMLSIYDKTLHDIQRETTENSRIVRDALGDIQKELERMRLESALLKQSSIDASKYVDRMMQLEKQNVIMESKMKAAFAIITGKRKAWEADEEDHT